jgi:hypothetical protein
MPMVRPLVLPDPSLRGQSDALLPALAALVVRKFSHMQGAGTGPTALCLPAKRSHPTLIPPWDDHRNGKAGPSTRPTVVSHSVRIIRFPPAATPLKRLGSRASLT